MDKKMQENGSVRRLRQRAAMDLQKNPRTAAGFSPLEFTRLTHELSIHQIELEMQNEELRRAQAGTEATRHDYADLFDFAPVGYFVLDEQGVVKAVNLAGAALLGRDRSVITGSRFTKFVSGRDQDHYYLFRKNIPMTGESVGFEMQLEKMNAGPVPVLLRAAAGRDPATGKVQCRIAVTELTTQKKAKAENIRLKEHLQGLVTKRTALVENKNTRLQAAIAKCERVEIELMYNEARLESLFKISQLKSETVEELLDFALNEAIVLTRSAIGYIYHYNDVKKEFVLNTWSKEVMKECSIKEKQTVYRLEKTGIWGEAVRQAKPIVVNDFHAPHPLKKGYPEGHAPLDKFMTVPVFSNDRIVGVVGVANKKTDYDDTDIRQLTLLMDAVWKIIDRNRSVAKLKAQADELKTINQDLSRFNSRLVDRELRMIELKKQVNELLTKLDLPQQYKTEFGEP